MPDGPARNHRGRALTLLVAGIAMFLFCLLTTASSSASTAGPRQATTTTTAAPMLPLTPDPALPHSGFGSGRLAGLAVSAMLIGWGVCSFGRGVRLAYVDEASDSRSRWRHARRPRHSAGWSWR